MKTSCLLVAAVAGLVPFVSGNALPATFERGNNCFNRAGDVSQNLDDSDYDRLVANINKAAANDLSMDTNYEWSLSWFGSMPAVRATLFGTPTKTIKYEKVARAVEGIKGRCGRLGGRQDIDVGNGEVITIKVTRA